MKTLLVVRHAKSSWDSASLSDFDRPLNGRGKKDAPEMAKRLLKLKIPVDAFISSPANRAKTTASYFIEAFGRKENELIFIPELYHASSDTFYDVVSQIENKYSGAAIFSHNPGITEFVNTLSQVKLDNMPTCAVFGISAGTDSWANFKTAQKEFLFFDYPKSGFDN